MRGMYHQYFGLSEAPFSIAVNPRYLFMSARHRDALAHLLYGVGAGGGFILLTGEVGTGKTTINRCLLEQLPDDTDIAIILNPALNAIELLASVCDELGIAYDEHACTLKSLTDRLHAYLLDNHARGRKTVLMIDEAQHLDFAVLEQIRLLTNLETNSEKLLQIILIGQPELAQLLGRRELRQLNQRITARYDLGPLNLAETRAYIQHRLQVAGMAPDRELFPAAVVRGIYQRTRGIPRLINVLCDRILLGAYGRGKSRADMATLRQAAREVLGEVGERESRPWPWGLAAILVVVIGLAAYTGYRYLAPNEVLSGLGGARSASDGGPDRPQSGLPQVGENGVGARSASDGGPDRPQSGLPQGVETGVGARSAIDDGPDRPQSGLPQGVEIAMGARSASDSGVDSPQSELPQAGMPWLLPPEEAAAQLWDLHTAEPFSGQLCGSALACVESEAQTWAELAALGRPLILDVVTPERFAAGVLLLDIEGRRGWVATAQGVSQVELASLAPLWRGRYRYLWQAPAGYRQPVALGDESPVVAQVADMFAQLDGQARALAGKRFNAALQQRVKLFQRTRGLEDDGVVGVRTLLELNQALGIDPTAQQARMALAGAHNDLAGG